MNCFVRKLLTALLCSCALLCAGQKGYGFGQDYYLYRTGGNSFVPCLYYQSAGGWYGQLHYNYEEDKTLSVQAGKTFSKGGALSWSVTPLAGLLAGRFTGGSVGMQAQAQAGMVSVYAAPQYCASFQCQTSLFFL